MGKIEFDPERFVGTQPAIPLTKPLRRERRLNPNPLTPTKTPAEKPQPAPLAPSKEPDKVPATR